ncbi:PD-(D/E)XK nuclease family protein [Marinilactibacillus psychrotolerans]|uniref:PD-(D/E)XK nuclease family protein n=1 Tax=Marinilactibacillus psychrotolerans TaxID=191770 RepID=UPI0039AFD557
MSLRFIIGRANTDKESKLIQEMKQTIDEDPTAQVFYLVPDHIKFETEINVLEFLKSKQNTKKEYTGMINLQVFSISRLAWYYLQNSAIYNKTQLTETGLSMLIRKLLKENEENLTIFRGQSMQQGFIEKLTGLFMEMRNGRITSDDLEPFFTNEQIQNHSGNDFTQKIADIKLLFQAFNYKLIGQYIEKEDIIRSLIEEIKNRDMSNTTIYINHYQSFSAQEQELIIELIRVSKQVTVSLVLDQKFAVEPPEMTHLFYETGITYHRLYQNAIKENLPVLNDTLLKEPSNKRCFELNYLENYWIESSVGSKISPSRTSLNLNECLEIWSAETKQAEVMHIANTIRRLVAFEGYRFKDIMLMSRSIEDYKTVLEPIFAENELSLFIDEPDSMAGHPLVEFIQTLFLITKRHWRYEDVMRFLRTELFVPQTSETAPIDNSHRVDYTKKANTDWRYKVDLTENVILAYGYEGSAWTIDQEWVYARYQLEEADEQLDADKEIQSIANQVRKTMRNILLPFFKKIQKAKTNKDVAQLLYQFMMNNGIDKQISYWRDQAVATGNLVEARKHEQVWETFIGLLDEFVDVLGNDAWDMDSFLAIIETGFEQATYSIVPPSLDQIMFTNFDKIRVNTKNVVFILGMTDTSLPLNQDNESILTDEDRETVQGNLPIEKFLAPSSQSILAAEPLAAYMAFSNASDKLIFSYPVQKDGSTDNRISPYIQRISDHLMISIQKKLADSHLVLDEAIETNLAFIGSRKQTIGQLVTVLREGLDRDTLPNVFWLSLSEKIRDYTNTFENRVFHSLEHKNIPVPLPPELAENLYGKDLYLSVSQLESFYLDPYSHFLQYGLKLRERAIQELTPMETGNFYHDALDNIFKTIIQRDIRLEELTDKNLALLADEVLEKMFDKNQFRLLSMSNRMKFIRNQLSKTVKKMMWAISNHNRRSKLTPQKSEVLFGRIGTENGIPGLSFPMKNGGKLHVRGKIDRLDTMEINQQLYLSIVDYKSSQHKFKFDELYYGLMMQMITYLDTAIEFSPELFGKKAKPAGAFYAQVQNPYVKPKKSNPEDWMLELLKEFKLTGLAINDEEVLSNLDLSLEAGKHSLIYPINQLKSGLLKGRGLMSAEELAVLFQHNRKLITDAGNKILSGANELQPFMEKRRFTPSVSGPYKAISQFDVLLDENNYRHFDTISDKNSLIEKISEKLILPGEEEYQ